MPVRSNQRGRARKYPLNQPLTCPRDENQSTKRPVKSEALLVLACSLSSDETVDSRAEREHCRARDAQSARSVLQDSFWRETLNEASRTTYYTKISKRRKGFDKLGRRRRKGTGHGGGG